VKSDPRINLNRRDETSDEQHDRELTQAHNEIRSLRHRVDVLERAARLAVTLLKPCAADRKR
jgi:hypothetical protein